MFCLSCAVCNVTHEAMSPRVLFVDDEAPIRELLSIFFEQRGLTVITATNSSDAMELANREQFSLAIVDLNLAGENGLELLGFLKTNHPKLPVIIFTGMNFDQRLMDEALNRGAEGVMSKTDSLDVLFREVKRVLLKF